VLNFKKILPKKNVKISDSDLLTLLVGLMAATGLWMYIAKLDVVSATIGSVVPSSQVKTIQHLEGGIVSKIYIKEGQQVLANQPLLDLESTDSKANVGEMLVRLATLTVKMARLRAESNGSEVIIFLSEVEKKNA
jgi:adhesin transport system membrane fusion protein